MNNLKVMFEYFCDNYNMSPIEELDGLVTYIEDYIDNRCDYCCYINCDETHNCRCGIFEYFKLKLL